jgi:DNA-binding IclR family transcriptional regulator
VLSRAIAILDSFSRDRPEQTLASIVRTTGLAPATVHRLLAELVEWGGLERTARGRYRIGLRLWQLGALAPGSRRLRDAALPYLEDLYEATHQVVHLAVLDAGEVLYVEKLSARPEAAAVSVASEVGKRLPLHATGPGKVLLAFSPPAVQEAVLAGDLARQTPQTITDPTRLRRSLAEVRRAGVCISRDEMTVGASSVAAPVFDADRTVVAAVSVVVPTGARSLAPLVPVVRAACLGITRALRQLETPDDRSSAQ